VEWKHGICAALGLPHRDQAHLAAAWRMILDKVRSWPYDQPDFLS
jgi:hypothetical protein